MEQAESISLVAEALAKSLEKIAGAGSLSTKDGVVFFKGKQGVRDLFDRVLAEQSDLYWLGPSKLFSGLDQDRQREMFQLLSVRRMDSTTTAFAISDEEFKTNFYFHGGSSSFRQLRTVEFLSETKALVVVTGNLCGFVKPFGKDAEAVLFEDVMYADIIRFSLRLVWNSIEEI